MYASIKHKGELSLWGGGRISLETQLLLTLWATTEGNKTKQSWNDVNYNERKLSKHILHPEILNVLQRRLKNKTRNSYLSKHANRDCGTAVASGVDCRLISESCELKSTMRNR